MQRNRRTAAVTLTASAALVLGGTVATTPASAKPRPHHQQNLAAQLVKDVRGPAVVNHLRAFQRIADRSGNDHRAGGTIGYDNSLQYIKAKLDRAGYVTEVQEFPFVYTEELRESFRVVSPEPRDVEVDVMTYSGAAPEGGVEAPLFALPTDDETPGCEAEDFADFPAGAVALVPRGSCAFLDKAVNAEAAGAVGTVVTNNDTAQPDLLVNGTLGTPGAVSTPVGGTSLNEGDALRAALAEGPVVVNLDLAELTEDRVTTNLIAEWPYGDPDKVVMAGAHLDSVPEGPGINDNGTGSAAILETALQLAKNDKRGRSVRNRVRFGWWGAEEFGLVGSTYYVDNLPEAELERIALYLNFDMVGSPNYIFGIYDGDDSDAEGEGPGPEGSAQIEAVLERYFDERGVPRVGTDFSGRSDYQAFINNDIPAGGLFTGAEGIKTEAHVEMFGGVAGESFDPCYHQACDSLTPVIDGADADLYAQLRRAYRNGLYGNVNVHALRHNSDAIAYAVGTFASSLSELTGEPDPPKGKKPGHRKHKTKHGIRGPHHDHGHGHGRGRHMHHPKDKRR